MSMNVKLLNAWQQVLKQCNVKAGETVLFLLADYAHPDHVAAGRAAATLLGAKILSLELGESPARMAGDTTAYVGPTSLSGNQAAIAAMKCADMVIDMMGIDRGTEQKEILDSGTRILLVKEPPEIFMRLAPTPDDRRRTLAAARRLASARSMHVKSAAGTDLKVDLGEYSCLMQYGLADEPGRWDHCPSTFVATWPNERTSNGTVVLDRGTTILPFKEYVRTPIRLSIRDGYIRDIEGEFDAHYLRDYMAKFDDPEGYAVSHLGWGLQKKAHWTTLGMYDKRQSNAMEARSFYGNFMFSTGPNLEGGGTRNTPCHLDIPMLGCSVHLDGEAMVVDDRIIPEDQRA
ncbi:MAG: 2,5-dihydroxypyridine 5,6-dioxygenase [Betaproteobacteria bacterium]|nr:2,5-dihydroxypyridine 5,6-dioxygenase [Betaproteobacteria bacterium]